MDLQQDKIYISQKKHNYNEINIFKDVHKISDYYEVKIIYAIDYWLKYFNTLEKFEQDEIDNMDIKELKDISEDQAIKIIVDLFTRYEI